jgi:hypothetical protein
MTMEAKEAVAMLRASIMIWRGDLAAGLPPTEGSLTRALARVEVIEKALYAKENVDVGR